MYKRSEGNFGLINIMMLDFADFTSFAADTFLINLVRDQIESLCAG